MITFEEDQSPGYRERTIKNASADITLAFAIDFNSAGERLTKSAVVEQKKKYIPIDVTNLPMGPNQDVLHRYIFMLTFGYKIETINIAGNGLYTMKNVMTQSQCDDLVYWALKEQINLKSFGETTIKLIRSGGQTGFDEAGLKAAVRLRIPALCLAPKGWKFRDITGTDISDEKQFKARFL